jgi:hypothetical protein
MFNEKQVAAIKRKWNSIFDKSKLSYRLSNRFPYSRTEVQNMIDNIKVLSGFGISSSEAEQSIIVELNALNAIDYAMKNATSLDIAAKETFNPNIISHGSKRAKNR